jgi:ribonuclease BN (tRNA processing enzyme)
MEMQRTRPLYLIGHQGVQEKIEQAMELCYPNFLEKLSYPLEYQVVTSDDKLQLFDLTWSFAETDHWQYNLALCLQGSEKSVYYSGDGGPTLRCQELARHCSLLIQEGFLIDKNVHGHGNLERSLQLTSNAQASQLAIVHMQRDVRKAEELNIRERLSQITDFKAILPEPGDELEL